MKISTNCLFALVFVALLAAGSFGSQFSQQPIPPNPGGIANQVLLGDPRTPINGLPFVITECGSYVVTKCLSFTPGSAQDGIMIAANDVSIDLNGFTLDGANLGRDGIAISGSRSNVSIRNGAVRNWTKDGINARLLSAGTFFNLRAIENGQHGLILGSSCVVTQCVGIGNGENGITNGQGGVLAHCAAMNNDTHGVSGSTATVYDSCSTFSNEDSGIFIDNGSLAAHCASAQNTKYGYFGQSGVLLTDSTAFGNTLSGVFMNDNNNTVQFSTMIDNLQDGISLEDQGFSLYNNLIQNNGNSIVTNGSRNTILGNFLKGGTIMGNDNAVYSNSVRGGGFSDLGVNNDIAPNESASAGLNSHRNVKQ